MALLDAIFTGSQERQGNLPEGRLLRPYEGVIISAGEKKERKRVCAG